MLREYSPAWPRLCTRVYSRLVKRRMDIGKRSMKDHHKLTVPSRQPPSLCARFSFTTIPAKRQTFRHEPLARETGWYRISLA